MVSLPKVAHENPRWSLDDFVLVTNQLLPQYLPIAKNNSRIREEINPRLVRHYTSQGMLDEPQKSGKFAVYTYRHLLQLLVVRRLLSEGIGSNAIDQLAIHKSNEELENLLTGGVQLEIMPANPALSYRQASHRRPSLAAESVANLDYTLLAEAALTEPSSPALEPRSWLRLAAIAGLEIHIRSDFMLPSTLEEQALLRDRLWQILEQGSQLNSKDKP